MKKIIVFGFPHCGTTILRSIIGHIDEVHDLINERRYIGDNLGTLGSKYKYVLCKYPFVVDLADHKYDDYIKIFIVRNPLYVFSSLNERYKKSIPDNHSIQKYISTISLFNHYRNNPVKDMYTIRYEDMFANNYAQLKNIFNSIGFNYTDDIFDNTKYKNVSHSGVKLVDYVPSNLEHEKLRNWQINQQFVSNNLPSKINLTEKQKNILLNDVNILKVYPGIKSSF